MFFFGMMVYQKQILLSDEQENNDQYQKTGRPAGNSIGWIAKFFKSYRKKNL